MSRGVYLNPPDYRRVNAAFLQAIAKSRNVGISTFPCWIFGKDAKESGTCKQICPLWAHYGAPEDTPCTRLWKVGLKHDCWITLYKYWLETMSKTFEEARKALESWEDFLKLDKLLSLDEERQKWQPSEAFLRVMRKIEEWEDEDKRLDTD